MAAVLAAVDARPGIGAASISALAAGADGREQPMSGARNAVAQRRVTVRDVQGVLFLQPALHFSGVPRRCQPSHNASLTTGQAMPQGHYPRFKAAACHAASVFLEYSQDRRQSV